MRNIDRYGGALWLILGAFVCTMSYGSGIGNLHKPGAGLAPLLAGTALAMFGAILMLSTFFRRFVDETFDGIGAKRGRRDSILALSALLGFVFLLEYLGFLITSFLFLMLLFKIKDTQRWGIPLVMALSATVVSYLVFSVWLKLEFPKGLLNF